MPVPTPVSVRLHQRTNKLDDAPDFSCSLKRREQRYPARVLVSLSCGSKTYELYTGDVSYRGLFLCTDNPPELRELIQIEATLPPNNVTFRSHGMSVFSVPAGDEDGRKFPGIGVQFYGQGDADRRNWEAFIRQVRKNIPKLPPTAIDILKRRNPRVHAQFEVRPANMAELKTLYSRDISVGGMFLKTNNRVPVGDLLELSILHPKNHREFHIASMVRRHSTTPQGLGVEFSADKARLEEFHRFIAGGIGTLVTPERDNIGVEANAGEGDDLDFELEEYKLER
ncbi:MAG: PilZ domain-containing protein [Kofleriaceae bacterium]|nr:PilZ domain-containing protein [Kofleriaceae bacterium]